MSSRFRMDRLLYLGEKRTFKTRILQINAKRLARDVFHNEIGAQIRELCGLTAN